MMPAQRQPHGLQPSLWDARAGAKVRAARAAAYPSTDEGQWEGVSEPPTARCTPAFTPQSSSSPPELLASLQSPAISSALRRDCWQPTLTTLGGSLCPGRYLTFSCSVLMMSVSRRPPTSSSSTHMFTWLSKLLSRAALMPTILAMAEPLQRAQGGRGSGHRGAQGSTGHAVTCGHGDGWHRLPGVPREDRGGQGPRCARRGDPGARAHQLPEPTMQTFLPPMVPGAGHCGLGTRLCYFKAARSRGGPGPPPAPPRPGGTEHPLPAQPVVSARQVQSAALEQLRSRRTRSHRLTESRNILSWTGPTRISEFKPLPCTGRTPTIPLCA